MVNLPQEMVFDFGGLFIGLSFFIIIASLILTISLFLISLASRSKEFYIMNALGFTHCEVRNLFFAEGAIIATIGAILGAPLGILYNNIIIYLFKKYLERCSWYRCNSNKP